MNQLKAALTGLPTLEVGGRRYLSYQEVTDKVAAFLFANDDGSTALTTSLDSFNRRQNDIAL
jgi:hypothetical protein